MLTLDASAAAQAGSIRGVVRDQEFSTPLGGAQVLIAETNQKETTSDQGNFVFKLVAPGRYTLVITREGYSRHVRADVVVSEGQLTDVDVDLAGEFTELDEFVVQDLLLGAGAEAALLQVRFESAALLDSISSDLMSRAGASDAASALRLVAGASLQDGKTAVIRGLPDRYVSSKMNGVRLPSADEDKRAVELDQFPAAVLESIQVSKSFTPDQQGDASGGAVDVRLKGIPDETIFQFKAERSFNTNVTGAGDEFLTYGSGGVNTWGFDRTREKQADKIGQSWDGAVGASEGESPNDYKLTAAIGGKRELEGGLKFGGFLSLFYERDSAYFDDGIHDSKWVTTPGAPLTPETIQGVPSDGNFKTALFDVTQASQSVQWGGLATLGVESEHHSIAMTYLYTRIAEDTVTLAIDTRGKEYYFPGYDPNDSMDPGNAPTTPGRDAAPYIRTDTLAYTERVSHTAQLHGHHEAGFDEGYDVGGIFKLLAPELDWTIARSAADLDQPDKRQFGALWHAPSFNDGGGFVPPFTDPATWFQFKPAANFTLGNLQRIWKVIEEDSEEYTADLRFPYEQWSALPGYLKIGVFDDQVDRSFNQDTYSNFNDNSNFIGQFDDPWTDSFPGENHPITSSDQDVDYDGEQRISALYGMADLPIWSFLSVVGGARFEKTKLSIVNDAEAAATWFPDGATAGVTLNPGDADVRFVQRDVLPAIGLVIKPHDTTTVRTSYSETVARQTFKEMTPILQQEFLGGPIFIGNPDLEMSSLKNYDIRVDFTPYVGGLVSLSWFDKEIEDPIEYVQRYTGFDYTTPVNYPDGQLRGWELEFRQKLDLLWEGLTGLQIGANATFIESYVNLSSDDKNSLSSTAIQAPEGRRDMTNAPEHLYNLYLTYDLEETGTQFAVFYTVQGDTLVAGAGVATGVYLPSIYATEYDTLNVSLTQKLGEHFRLQLQAKNLTNPEIQEVYRSDYTGKDVTYTSYTKGIDYSIAIGAEFRF